MGEITSTKNGFLNTRSIPETESAELGLFALCIESHLEGRGRRGPGTGQPAAEREEWEEWGGKEGGRGGGFHIAIYGCGKLKPMGCRTISRSEGGGGGLCQQKASSSSLLYLPCSGDMNDSGGLDENLGWECIRLVSNAHRVRDPARDYTKTQTPEQVTYIQSVQST